MTDEPPCRVVLCDSRAWRSRPAYRLDRGDRRRHAKGEVACAIEWHGQRQITVGAQRCGADVAQCFRERCVVLIDQRHEQFAAHVARTRWAPTLRGNHPRLATDRKIAAVVLRSHAKCSVKRPERERFAALLLMPGNFLDAVNLIVERTGPVDHEMMLVLPRRYGDAVGALREQVDRGRAMESETAQIDRAFEFRVARLEE